MGEKPESAEKGSPQALGAPSLVVSLRSDRVVRWFYLDLTSLVEPFRIQGWPEVSAGFGFSEIPSPRDCFVCPRSKPTHASPSSAVRNSTRSQKPTRLVKATGLSLRDEPGFLKRPAGDRCVLSLGSEVSSGGFLST